VLLTDGSRKKFTAEASRRWRRAPTGDRR